MKFYLNLLLILSAPLIFSACKERNNTGGEPVYRQVSFKIAKTEHQTLSDPAIGLPIPSGDAELSPDAKSVLVLGLSSSQLNSGITAIGQAAQDSFDKNLLDIDDRTITLTLPVGISLALVVFVYDEELSQESILNGETLPIQIGFSDPFQIYGDTTELNVLIHLRNFPFIFNINNVPY